jgi:hypothetical protein
MTIEAQEVITMIRQTPNREGRIVDRLVEIVSVMLCTVIAPYGLVALNNLPTLPVV